MESAANNPSPAASPLDATAIAIATILGTLLATGDLTALIAMIEGLLTKPAEKIVFGVVVNMFKSRVEAWLKARL